YFSVIILNLCDLYDSPDNYRDDFYDLFSSALSLTSKVINNGLMFTLNCKGNLLMIDKPLVMGIINATPDSLYNRHEGTESVLLLAEQMLKEGAAILDIGGQSTRPGS